jgi:hypothetical protein
MNSNYTYNVKTFKYMKKNNIYKYIETNLHMYGGKENYFIENDKSG